MMRNNHFYPAKEAYDIYSNRINNLIDNYNTRKDLIDFLKHHNVELGKLQNIDHSFLKTYSHNILKAYNYKQKYIANYTSIITNLNKIKDLCEKFRKYL